MRYKKRKRFSLHRLTNKFVSFGKSALECIRTYPTVRREVPVNVVDVISSLCVIGVTAVAVVFIVTGNA